MNKKILYITWLLFFALPLLLFSQKSEENIKHLIEVVNNIDKHGGEKFFSMIKPLVKSPKDSLYDSRKGYNLKGIDFYEKGLVSHNHELSYHIPGFDSEKTPEGIGHKNIKSRLKRINGDFNIDSKPERGTIINIEIPLTITQNET